MNEKNIMMDLEEWDQLLTELSAKEVEYYSLKESYENRSEEKKLRDTANELKNLEFRIAYIKRRISYLKHVVRTKNNLMEKKQ